MKPIVITGGSGQVGSALRQRSDELAALGYVVHFPTRDELDLARHGSIRQYLREVQPAWIINPGAYTAVDKAEEEKELAYSINAEAPAILGEEAARLGAGVIHFSTDYVFSGRSQVPYREDDATGPLNVYGASKLSGEIGLAASGAPFLTLRTSWVYSATGRNFLLTLLRIASQRPQMQIVDDQFGSPTAAGDLASICVALVRYGTELQERTGIPLAEAIRAVQGIYHVAAAGETTWYRFASKALRLRKLHQTDAQLAQLLPIPASEYPTAAKRPTNSRLNCSKLTKVFSLQMRPWQEALAEVLDDIQG